MSQTLNQITIEYKDGKPANVKSVVISTQHSADVDQSQVRKLVMPYIEKSIPKNLLNNLDEKNLINQQEILLVVLTR